MAGVDSDLEAAADEPMVQPLAAPRARLSRALVAHGLTWASRVVFVATVVACVFTGARFARSAYAGLQEPAPPPAATAPAGAGPVEGVVQLADDFDWSDFEKGRPTAREQQEAQEKSDLFSFIFCLIGLGLQFYAYKRSTGVPYPIADGLVPGDKMQSEMDIYGQQTLLTQVVRYKELCGIEAKNKYMAADSRLYISERSDCCQRIIASTNRELTLFAHAGPSEESPVVMRMYKPYHLQGCCFCRPKMMVDMPDGSPIGRVEDPCACCVIDQKILDARENLRFTVNGSICQCGACCPMCADFNFTVHDNVGMQVGGIVKPALTCSECCLKTNRFALSYPQQATMDDKRLLTAAAMLLDLQYFEVNKKH